ncbi:MAG: excalibur calcium-binding domain-containing protein [Xanthomonadales bacterium]|nr:excalibur calcium-binding domain-containing protein [Xanthomonadales bacterium]
MGAVWLKSAKKSGHPPSPRASVRGAQPTPTTASITQRTTSIESTFTCDGRKHCSQMTSCAEATCFIQHCPDTQMDGDYDGRPCESQWCSDGWGY